MFPKWRLRSLIILFLITSTVFVSAAFGKMRKPPKSSSSDLPLLIGSARTLLPDGRLLISGGQSANGHMSGTLYTVDPLTGTVSEVSSALRFPRAAHTATVLPNGTVLILGGIGQDGKIVASSEVFDPVSESDEPLTKPLPTPRAFHTATLLTDGRVLVAGGVLANSGAPSVLELWDFRGQNSTLLSALRMDRRNHTAALQADGRVLFTNGEDKNGNSVNQAQIYDPQSQTLSIINAAQASQETDTGLTEMRASSPQDGAQNVPVDALISVRFSRPVQMPSIGSTTMTLQGPDGVITGRTVAAEGGMLAFVTLANGLSPATTYTLTISGAVDAQNQNVAYAQFSFSTAGSAGGNVPISSSDEQWLPTSPSDWVTHRPPSTYASLPDLEAAKGTTALSGQILKLNGDPLPNVTLEVGNRHTKSDRTGRFILTEIPAGHQVLVIEGATANTDNKKYGRFEFGDEIKSGTTNKLDFKIWMSQLDMLHEITIASPTTRETILTTPTMPGLELRLAAGTVITDASGKPVTKITITPIPLDRPPFPLPFVVVPTYFTIQPGGAYVSVNGKGPKGARLFYPNTEHKNAGVPYAFWNYSADHNGWYVYGAGRVNQQGTQVVPNPGVAIYDFSGAMVGSGDPGPSTGDPAGNTSNDGEPVGLSTGLFTYNKTDLILPDVIPLNLTRTYRPNDSWSRPFGIGATHPYEMFVGGDGNEFGATQYVDLILPNGSRIHFTGVGSGPYYSTYLNSTAGTSWYGATITCCSTLTTKDGTVYTFPESPGLVNPGCQALIGITDRNGNHVTVTRNNDANCTIAQITSPSGRYIQFQYDSSYRIKVATDNIGRQVFYNYDASGRLYTVTDANGGVWTYGYDSMNRMTTIQDPRQITYLTNIYDGNGMVHYQYLADGTSFYQFDWTTTSNTQNATFYISGGGIPAYNVLAFRACNTCSEGFPALVSQVTVTDPRGYKRQVSFNQQGYATADTRALGMTEQQTTSYSYSPDNLISSVTDQLGRVTNSTYDLNANTTSVTQLAGTQNAVTASMTYDSVFSNLLTLTDPLGNVTSWQYDINGDAVSVTDPLQHQISMGYNAMGLVTTITDALQNTTRFSYDSGDLVGITDPLLNTSTFFHDGAGRVLSKLDPLGHATKYQYNNLNEVIQVTDPVQGVTTLTYDLNGNLQTIQDARQQGTTFKTVYSYDNFDHPNTRTDPLGRQETYNMDQLGNLTSFIDRRGKTTKYSYDGLNRRTFAGYGASGTTYESSINYYYDGGSRFTSVVDSAYGTTTPAYDLLDRLTSETTPSGSVTYKYDNDNRLTSATVNGQPSTCYSYDNASRLTGIGQGTCPTSTNVVTVTYDNANRRSTLSLPNGIVLTYGYDNDSRVNSMSYQLGANSVGNLTYQYDAGGRLIQKGGTLAATAFPSAVNSATYDVANELTSWNGTTISYDANGNIQNDGVAPYVWNARNQLASRGSTTYAYDGYGRRSINGAGTGFVYEGINAAQELSNGTPTANRILGQVDEFLTRTDSTGSFSPITDAQGSVLALSDSSGKLATQYTYDPFGNTTSTGAISTNAFQYTGRENDQNGLYFYRARYYSPSLGRFISEDPIGFANGMNKYAYVGNNPTMAIDPTGKSNSYVHYSETLEAALAIGMSWTDANALAALVVAVDFYPGSQGLDWLHTAMHAMAGRKPNGQMETCPQAYHAAVNYVNKFTGIDPSLADQAAAIHAIQDSYSYSHQYKPWDGHLTWAHEQGDWPTPDEAVTATIDFLRDVRDFHHAWGGGQYLNDVMTCEIGINLNP